MLPSTIRIRSYSWIALSIFAIILVGYKMTTRLEPVKQQHMTPKEEVEILLNDILPLAIDLLEKNKLFYPFAMALSANEQKSPLMTGDGSAETLKNGLIMKARNGEVRATGMAINSTIIDEKTNKEFPIIDIYLDHQDDYSVVVWYPYEIGTNGKIIMGEPTTERGKNEIFTK